MKMGTMKELQRSIEWLEHRHKAMQDMVKQNDCFNSDYMKGSNDGMKMAVEYYGEEIARIRQLLDGYMVEDVDLTGGIEHVS